jgi:hypothetical protein
MSNRSRYAQTASDDSTPDAVDSPVGEHTHEQPRSVLVTVLTAVVVLLAAAVGWLGFNTYMLQRGQAETTAYIEGRGTARDAENQRLNDRIDAAVCSLLDSLPAGPLLDPQRAQYGCGPGIPVGDLDPTVAQNLADILGQIEAAQPAQSPSADSEPAQPTSAPDEMPPGAPEGVQPSPMGQPPTPTAAPTSAPASSTPAAPTTPPLVDLTPLTDPVCTLLGVCL